MLAYEWHRRSQGKADPLLSETGTGCDCSSFGSMTERNMRTGEKCCVGTLTGNHIRKRL